MKVKEFLKQNAKESSNWLKKNKYGNKNRNQKREN